MHAGSSFFPFGTTATLTAPGSLLAEANGGFDRGGADEICEAGRKPPQTKVKGKGKGPQV
jgi:hypothetical protein